MSATLIAQRILWFLPMLLQLTVAAVMVRRRLYKELPMFFAFILFDLVASLGGFLLRDRYPPYFYWYWICEGIAAGLGFAVIYEVFTNVVKRYETIHRFGFVLYRWAAVVLLVMAAVTAATAPDAARIFDAIVTLERGVRIVQTGLLLVLFVFASYLGLSWRSNLFGVALGFGMYASVELTLAAISAHTRADQLYIWVKSVAYNTTTVIWAVYIIPPQRKPEAVASPPKSEAGVWAQALADFLRR